MNRPKTSITSLRRRLHKERMKSTQLEAKLAGLEHEEIHGRMTCVAVASMNMYLHQAMNGSHDEFIALHKQWADAVNALLKMYHPKGM